MSFKKNLLEIKKEIYNHKPVDILQMRVKDRLNITNENYKYELELKLKHLLSRKSINLLESINNERRDTRWIRIY